MVAFAVRWHLPCAGNWLHHRHRAEATNWKMLMPARIRIPRPCILDLRMLMQAGPVCWACVLSAARLGGMQASFASIHARVTYWLHFIPYHSHLMLYITQVSSYCGYGYMLCQIALVDILCLMVLLLDCSMLLDCFCLACHPSIVHCFVCSCVCLLFWSA